MTGGVVTAIGQIGEDAWIPIRYPNAIWDAAEGRWICDAEVAEIGHTAFPGPRQREHVTAQLIVRRVRRLNPASAPAGQDELFAAHRYHACLTDSPSPMLDAQAAHRGHPIVEQVIADMTNGPLAHLPSASFPPTGLAGRRRHRVPSHPRRRRPGLGVPRRASTATIRAHLIDVPARPARSARRVTLHPPQDWPWEHARQQPFDTTMHAPPEAA